MIEAAVRDRSRRQGASLKALGMFCDADGVPRILGARGPYSCWLCGSASYLGDVADPLPRGLLGPAELAVITGIAVVTVEESRLLGILEPIDPSEPSVWWSWSNSLIAIKRTGLHAILRSVPFRLSISNNGNAVELGTVYRLDRRRKKYFDEEELPFLTELHAKRSAAVIRESATLTRRR